MKSGTLVRAMVAVAALLASAGLASPVHAQAGSIAGTVTDSATGQPVSGAQVVVVGTTRGDMTDAAGNYTINGVPAGAVTLRAQRIGYGRTERRVTVTAGGTQRVNLAMPTVVSTLDQVVVTGYGETDRRNVSSSVAKVAGSEVQAVPLAGVDAALQGKAPGVQVVQNAGNPGVGITVRIRGSASLSATNQPLYVIDGVPMISDDYSQMGVGGQDITAVTGISPNDIESIDVLKDAAAAAIYGSRASNGVVMITTKRGRPGSARVSFSTYYGIQEVTKKVGVLNSTEYVTYMNEATTNDGYPPLYGTLGVTDTIDTDWQEEVFRQAPVADYFMGVQGGSDRMSYALSGSWFRQDGVVIGSGYNRGTGRVNADFTVNDRFTVRSSMQLGSEVHQRIVNDNTIDGVVTNAIANQPYVPVRLPNGDFTSPDDGLDYSNAVAIGTLNSNETRTYRGLGNVEGIVTLSSAFRLNGRVGFDLQNLRDLSWESPHIIGTYAAGVDGVAEYGSTTAHRYLTEAYGTYDFARGMINQLQVVVGAGAEWNSYENSYLRGEGYATDDFRYPGNAATVTTYAAGKSGHNLVSAFSRANLNVLDRYLLTASIRTDGSSRFGERNRYGVFPAISAGWLLTSESFGAPLRRIGDIKLRASYGLTGNQGISDDFASLGRFGRANYAGEAGIAQSSLGNPDLRWEQTAEFDVGFDVEMFRGRVSLIADYYRKLTSDLLVQRPITSTSGLTSVWENVGNIENKGFELGLTTVNIESPVRGGLRWETSLNVSTLDNKVTKLFRNEPFNTGIRSTNRVEVGQPLGAYHVLDFTGVDPATGDAKYRDVNGDGTVNSEDRIIAGSPHPDYWGGFRNTLTWKGFDVMAFFQFSQGNKIFNAIRIFADDGGYYNDNKFKNVLNRWQKPGDITNEPRASWDGASDARRVSDRYIEDGSYVRFQEITVGYRVPDDLAAVTRLSNVRVYVSGVNIHTWTDFSGYSPDVNSNGSGSNISLGTEFYAYPLARTIRAGVSASW